VFQIHALVLAACLVSAGCGHGGAGAGSAVRPEADPAWLFLAGVPFVPQQQELDCGAAALAMALGHGGQPASVADISAVVGPEKDKGIFAGRLRDYARRRGFEAYLIEGTWDDLRTELGRGHPVLVGLVKTVNRRRFPHYELVVGLRRDGARIITLDPASGRREQSTETFLVEWGGASHVALVVWRGLRVGRSHVTVQTWP
jgi:ABC-type bacteriocin/lantibiotic exporter with double-glycine peptidase domain